MSSFIPGFGRKKEKNVFDSGEPGKLYDLLECLGEGTYGTVWTGSEKATGKTCAVKIVKIDDDLEEIQQEIAIMKDSDSPYIVKFYGAYWAEKERIWMVMEHCIAGSINDLMYVCDITLNIDEVRTTAAAIALGLKYLHKNLVIHRDIKAGNVLLTAEGYIRLADFGVSAKLKKPSDRTTTAIGAPFWMAPEVISEVPYDGKADVWSLGITVIELVEGRPPNSHMNAMKALFIIPQQEPPRLKDPRLPRDMHDFVRVCLTKSPKKRPTSKLTIQHPFIRDEARDIEVNGGRSEIMRKLVENSLKKIEKWRKDEDEETEWESKDGGTVVESELSTPMTQLKSPPQVHPPINRVQQQTGPSVTLTELLPVPIQPNSPFPSSMQFPKSPQIANTPREYTPQPLIPPLAIGSSTMKSHKSNRSSFLNPARDAKFRQSARLSAGHAQQHVEPLRDVAQPKKSMNEKDKRASFMNKGNQNKMSAGDVADIMNSDLPASSDQVQAAVMTKEFIMLLKSIYKNDPESFGNKAPKNWTGEDITVAVVKALTQALDSGDNGAAAGKGKGAQMSNTFMSGMKKGGLEEGELLDDIEEQDAYDAKEHLELLQFMNPHQFVVGRDGDHVPPPPPSASSAKDPPISGHDLDEDSDLQI